MTTGSTDGAMARTGRRYRIVDLNYITFYIADFQRAIDFYSQVFGPPDSVGSDMIANQGLRSGVVLMPVASPRGSLGASCRRCVRSALR